MANLTFTSKVKLNDGHEIPLFGLGVYLSHSGTGGECEKSVEYALKYGYRLIDTAQFYANEEDVGSGIVKSGIPREEVYVVTKLKVHGYDECKSSLKESLKKLGTDYVDLFLIHSPRGGKNVESYDAMIEMQKEGLIRSIGVSNFGIHHLEALRQAGKPTPSVNQIELHPYCRYEALVEYCKLHGIAVMGYSPLARGKFLDDPKLVKLGEKYKKTPAQILIRWSVQLGYITIPKSVKPKRIEENADVFDFVLQDDEIKLLNSDPTDHPVTLNRLEIPWEG